MIKWIGIILIIAVLSFWHIHGSRTVLESHLLHQELFFIPIILAAFWFRLRSSVTVAVIISIIYFSSMQYHMNTPSIKAAVYMQIFLYIFIAGLLGWLTNRLDKQQQQTVKDEKGRAIIKLASALSYEIYEIANSLESKYTNKNNFNDKNISQDFNEEINKLKLLTKAFEQIGPPESQDLMSRNLNEIVKNTQRKFQPRAKKSQIHISVELEEAGCPTMVLSDSVIQLFGSLVENAIEASPDGGEIILRSTRKGTYCLLEVIDFGRGVSTEDVTKLFKPFFTTKDDGHGLSLAAGKKIMEDLGGELLYEPGSNGGSIFKLVVPRENLSKNIDGHISEKIGNQNTI